ncbi:MAG TPA: PEGA domain-containing protein, partial [Kofleriaceae bacterium]|nr:PEGA domain-containing protein [Kofleriaceae bacterium]
PMSAHRVAVLAGVVLASASAHAGERRVGFAVLAGSEARSRAAVESARAECAGLGLAPVGGELRAALEEPLPPEGEREVALTRARRQLGAAEEAYKRFDYERALADLGEVDRLVVDREPTPPVVRLMVERHLLAGLVEEGRRRPVEARRAFRAVQHLDPDRRALDAGAYRPQVVALFAQAARDDGHGALHIAAEPAGARVFVDGRPAGVAPLDLEHVSSGPHWVVAAAPGRSPRGAMIDVADERRPAERSLSLHERPPAESAAELRRAVGRADDRARRTASAALAGAARVDLLVLVRAHANRVEAAVFDARRGLLSPWLAMPSERFSHTLAAGASPGGLAPGADPMAAGGLSGSAPAADRAPSWYTTWWGRTLIVAGGVVVGGAIILAATSGGDDPGYSVGGFCFAGRDC